MAEKFIPKGCLPLKSAIKRLAEARQTSVRSARAEIWPELHSGSMRAGIIRPDTGGAAPIIPDRWALDDARSWLEQGECILTDSTNIANFTLPMFSGPHRATIFVFESDLDRLIKTKPKGEDARERPVISEVEADRLFRNWRKSCGDYIPTPVEDYIHMKQFGVSRERVRQLRKGKGIAIRPRGRSRQSKPKSAARASVT
jgi:hypothetical protein